MPSADQARSPAPFEALAEASAPVAPRLPLERLSPRAWIWFHLKIGLFGFGHGAIMPLYERALVRDSGTLTQAEFHESLTASLVLPGPSLITLSMLLGRKLYGNMVSLLAVLAMCVPGALWALFIVYAVPIHAPAVEALFRGFTMGALVLLVAMVYRLSRGLASAPDRPLVGDRRQQVRLAISLLVAVLLALHVPMVIVAAVGVATCLGAEFLT